MNFGFLFFIFVAINSLEDNSTDLPTPTLSPEPIKTHPPSAVVVWITCIIGVIVIGCTVLVLCIKKQPDDILFETSKEHLNNIATLNTIQSLNENNLNNPLMFTPEGSLN